MVINSSGKSPFEIRDSAGKEFKEIYNSDGRLVFKNWNEIQGTLPLTFKSRADYLEDYRIYGNTIQDGTPTPENPIEVRGCGEYDFEINGYKIPVTVSNGTNSITTPVDIGSEPLYKIDGYADYIDFERGVVVRQIKKSVLTGNERYETGTIGSLRIPIAINLPNTIISTNTLLVLASHYITNDSSEGNLSEKNAYTIRRANSGPRTWAFLPKSFFSGEISSENCLSQFKSYLAAQYAAGTPFTIWYVLAKPEEEPIENLLPIQTIKGMNTLSINTTVQPSEIYLKGKIKSLATHMLVDSSGNILLTSDNYRLVTKEQ